MMGAVGSVAAAVFGVIWMVGAASAGAPASFTLFDLVFVGEFCPFCGAKASPEFDYCPHCGKDI